MMNHILLIYPCNTTTLIVAPFTRFGGSYFRPSPDIIRPRPQLRVVPSRNQTPHRSNI